MDRTLSQQDLNGTEEEALRGDADSTGYCGMQCTSSTLSLCVTEAWERARYIPHRSQPPREIIQDHYIQNKQP